jgi:hypothetical protein
MALPIKSRRWFTYSLRTLFVLVTAVGLWLGWELHIVHEQSMALEWLQSNRVSYSIWVYPAFVEDLLSEPSGTCSFNTTLESSACWSAGSSDGAHVLRRLLGTEETMTSIHLPHELGAHAARLQRIYPAAAIDVEPAPDSD